MQEPRTGQHRSRKMRRRQIAGAVKREVVRVAKGSIEGATSKYKLIIIITKLKIKNSANRR